jgi:hypothetical protein
MDYEIFCGLDGSGFRNGNEKEKFLLYICGFLV